MLARTLPNPDGRGWWEGGPSRVGRGCEVLVRTVYGPRWQSGTVVADWGYKLEVQFDTGDVWHYRSDDPHLRFV